ncbi:MAG: hypothetical protein EPO24_07325 [Bacteroidetes bacterium]|nr:MAG: hypothetical protein EPO24_07325 [Bacteroidota bacterium]
MKKYILIIPLLLAVTANLLYSQFYIGPHVGFKSSGLKGAYKLTTQGAGTQTGNVVDAGKTGFNFGLQTGYQVFPPEFAGGWYKLDINLDASYSSFAYFEEAYNSQFGAGKFGADGLSGGSTMIISLDVMPIHRLTMPNFTLLSPYAGIGLGMNIMSTKDISVGPPNQPGTLTGAGEFKIGLLVFYGCTIQASDMIQPYLQLKHYVPFGSDTKFTNEAQGQIVAGGGTTKYETAIQDVPGYFGLSAGVRFVFDTK